MCAASSASRVGLTFPPMAMLADTLSAMITLLGKEKGRTATPSGLSEVMRQAARPRPRGRVPQPPVLRPHRREARRSEERRVGKELSVRVDLGGRRSIKKKKQNQHQK